MWQIILCISFAFLILEMFTPSMFFLNFFIAGLFCAMLSLFTQNLLVLTLIFSILSITLIFTLRPLLMKNFKDKSLKTGMEAKYVGKKALVVEDVNKTQGVISIYDERWQARNIKDETILKGSMVEIVNYESIVMYVKQEEK